MLRSVVGPAQQWAGLPDPSIDPPPGLVPAMIHAFSIATDPESHIVGFTHVGASTVTFWDAERSTFLRKLDFPGAVPMGLALTPDGRHFLVAAGKSAFFVSKSTLEVEPKLTVEFPFESGSHITRWPG